LTEINLLQDGDSALSFPILVDGGDAGSTCHDASWIHGYKPLTRDKYFNDAKNHTHKSVGEGYICLATYTKGVTKHFMIHLYHTPSIKITVLSPGRTVLRHPKQFDAHTIYTSHVTGKGYTTFHGTDGTEDVKVPGIVRGVLLYAQALRPAIGNYIAQPMTPMEPDEMGDKICHLSVHATRILWHQRMGHVHMHKLSDLHKHVGGIPQIAMPSDAEHCTT
jgi:hypothetical protein